MTVTIRQGKITDATEIATIIQLAFDETAFLAQLETCLSNPHFCTYVAEYDGKILGFNFGFITTSVDGKKRRELDLQAVHPDYQGQGIGKKLIQQFTGAETEADYIRALIAVGNVRMEKALTRLGYTTDDEVCGLYVSSQSSDKATVTPIDSHLIPVVTMTYNGIWLEGHVTPQAVEAAHRLRKSDNDMVGAVVPITDQSAIEALQSANFEFIKQYRRWHKPIVNS